MTNKGRKYDNGKLRMDLIPPEAMEELAKVLTFGSLKYEDNNWQKVDKKRYDAALMRHYIEYKKGNKVDEESGLDHLSHLLCNVAFLIWKEKNE